MKCPNCPTENREAMKFFEQCGAKMERDVRIADKWSVPRILLPQNDVG